MQTLEPRAFYVYIPFRNQNQLPVFDTALDDFNFSQLFSENRYVGNDRIGDANQLTLARDVAAARSGERRRAAALRDRPALLLRGPAGDPAERDAALGSTSDILVGAEGRLSDAWSLNGLVQYNLDSGRYERLNLGAR